MHRDECSREEAVERGIGEVGIPARAERGEFCVYGGGAGCEGAERGLAANGRDCAAARMDGISGRAPDLGGNGGIKRLVFGCNGASYSDVRRQGRTQRAK